MKNTKVIVFKTTDAGKNYEEKEAKGFTTLESKTPGFKFAMGGVSVYGLVRIDIDIVFEPVEHVTLEK